MKNQGLIHLFILAAASAVQAGVDPPIFADGFESRCGQVGYQENFALDDGDPWPEPWVAVGSVDVADVQGGGARLRPTPGGYSLARMYAPVDTQDVELSFTFRLEDATTQGVGFYVRSNGGYLDETLPAGEGYAVFLEGTFRGRPGISVWKEENGREQELQNGTNTVPPPQQSVNYRVRLRVHQEDAENTRLQAKMWPVGDPEPPGWQVSHLDATAVLQNVSGGIAVDSWSVRTAAPITDHTFVDDIEIEPLCNPVATSGTPTAPVGR
ncbi:MAG: hypothetical protein QNJ40_17750 [Xanthomonadales bacterium]|nr:hypothetical protein [Xanthomonadales bacterium]